MDKNITRHEGKIERRKGDVLWFTGLSGAGKSTIAALVESALCNAGLSAYLLDGDNLRFGLNSDLGFSDADRNENIRRIYETAALFSDAGIITLVSAISPFAASRNQARIKIGAAFMEIFVKADIELCKSRDPKGLYKKAAAGEIKNFTGLDSPYEPPLNPDILIDTAKLSPISAASYIVERVFVRIMPVLLENIAADAIKTAISAGYAIMDVYSHDFDIEYKSDSSPLTLADKVSNDIIYESLKKYLPYIGFLSEESADDKSRLTKDFCFIIDPLDGTKEFIKKNGEFTVNIALTYKNRPILGVIYIPVRNELYYAVKNRGAYKVDISKKVPDLFSAEDKISVSTRIEGLVAIKSRSHGDQSLDALIDANRHRIASEITAGSSIKGCLIADGTADVYYRPTPTMEWDTCAMHAIAQEAGALFLQGDHTEMLYNRDDNLNSKGFIIVNHADNLLD